MPETLGQRTVLVKPMADSYEVNVAPHNFYGHLATLMAPNLRIMEIDPDRVPWYDDLVTAPQMTFRARRSRMASGR